MSINRSLNFGVEYFGTKILVSLVGMTDYCPKHMRLSINMIAKRIHFLISTIRYPRVDMCIWMSIIH